MSERSERISWLSAMEPSWPTAAPIRRDNRGSAMSMVLMYHSVEAYTKDPYRVTVHPDRFERQMRWLRSRGLRGTSVAELLAAQAEGRARGLIGLTFDDGYADFATHVLPVLLRYGFGATVFVVAGQLGGVNAWDEPGPRKALLTTDQIRAVAGAGIEIGSHSLSHPRLSMLPEGRLRGEVRDSGAILGDVLGREVAGFCYPYGALGAREADAVAEAGYAYACAVGKSTVDGDISTVDGRFAIRRTYVGDRDTSLRLLAKRLRHELGERHAARTSPSVHSGRWSR
jgi:peptidoglycan/xylan/chitin deacetylase (PgdA/CDA1 family)